MWYKNMQLIMAEVGLGCDIYIILNREVASAQTRITFLHVDMGSSE